MKISRRICDEMFFDRFSNSAKAKLSQLSELPESLTIMLSMTIYFCNFLFFAKRQCSAHSSSLALVYCSFEIQRTSEHHMKLEKKY
jgi:hypothetical protein